MPAGPPAVTVLVAASYVAEPLQPFLRLWCDAYGLAVPVRFAGFQQVVPTLLDPQGLFRSAPDALSVVLTRPEDLASALHPDGIEPASLLLDAIADYARRWGRLVVGDLPPVVSPDFQGDHAAVSGLQRFWRERLDAIDEVEVLDLSSIVTLIGIEQAADPLMEKRASTPYRPLVYQHLGRALARLVRRRCLPARKLIALDGDNTLWGGVLGEDGPDGLRMDGGFDRFQRRLRALRDHGVLLALVSKNEEGELLEMLRSRTDCLLKPEDFAALRIGWGDKGESLRSIAAELNLGVDSFVFIDDNPVERATVAASCPGVIVVPLPEDPSAFAPLLDRLWCFDGIGVSQEDRSRTALLAQERLRRAEQEASSSLEDYLNDLGLQVSLREAGPEDHPRLAQLTQRTNQFNLSLQRRQPEEIARLQATGAQLWVVRAGDRFGEYGLVGLVVLLPPAEDGTARIDSFLLSCRALGRGVEQAVLHGLCRRARQQGIRELRAHFVVAPRNAPVLEFFRRQGWHEQGEDFVGDLEALPALPAHVQLSMDG